MNTVETIIKKIKDDVNAAKDQGDNFINTDKLLDYLEQLKDSLLVEIEMEQDLARYAHEREIEKYRADNNANLANYTAFMQQGRELTKAVIDIGQAAIKSVILINGASAVALLTLIGNLWVRNNEVAVSAILILMPCIKDFAIGTLLGALSAGATYFCQLFYSLNYNEIIKQKIEGEPDKSSITKRKRSYLIAAKTLHVIALVTCIAAYYYFGSGIYSSNEAFLFHFNNTDFLQHIIQKNSPN